MFLKIGELLAPLPHELYVFLISIVPFIELRGSIPVGAALELPFYINYVTAVIGNMLPVPFILFFIPKILDYLTRFKPFRPIVSWLRSKANKNSKKILGKAAPNNADTVDAPRSDLEENGVKNHEFITPAIFLGLLLFVALPIPGTGAWTGSLVAALFDLSKKASFIAILLGVMICGIIMSLASYGAISVLNFLI